MARIPYATPPVGPLRWRNPTLHAPWTSPFSALEGTVARRNFKTGCVPRKPGVMCCCMVAGRRSGVPPGLRAAQADLPTHHERGLPDAECVHTEERNARLAATSHVVHSRWKLQAGAGVAPPVLVFSRACNVHSGIWHDRHRDTPVGCCTTAHGSLRTTMLSWL